jgi:hypothetical protein
MTRNEWPNIVWKRADDLPDIDAIPIEPINLSNRVLSTKDKRAILENFIRAVESGRKLHQDELRYVAWGVQQHLDGQKPWPELTGIKYKVSLADIALELHVHKKNGLEYVTAQKLIAAKYEITEKSVRRYAEQLVEISSKGERCPR